MNQMQEKLFRAIRDTLAKGQTVRQVGLALGISDTEVENLAANAERNYQEIEMTTTTKNYESTILANAFAFEGQKLARKYLKAKANAIKMKGAYVAEAIKEAQEARSQFAGISKWLPEEFSTTDVVTEFCGIGREWAATGKMVAEFAAKNNIDMALAAELVTRQLTTAQDYTQATRAGNIGKYVGWLEDAAADEGNISDATLEDILVSAYNRAAKFNSPADGLLIRDFAESQGCSECLPTWAEALQKNLPSAEEAAEARKRMSNRAAAAAAAEQEAEQGLLDAYGKF